MHRLIKLILRHKLDIILISGSYSINVFVHSLGLKRAVDVFTDAGVFVYSAKLISEGLVPYRDFFLSNSSFLLYLSSIVLKVVDYDMIAFNFIYILWFFSSIVPIYFIVLRFTKNKIAALLSITLFSTFAELVQWDAHSFALRQASLPFLAFALFFIFVKRKLITAGILLAFFALSIPTNILISSSLILTFLLGEFIFEQRNAQKLFLNNLGLIASFAITLLLGYFLILIPQNSLQNLLGYQLNRPLAPYQYRIDLLKGELNSNWPILILGLLGSLILNKRVKLFGLFNILTVLIVVFTGASFYPHYITIFAVGFAISAGILIGSFEKSIITTTLISVLIFYFLYNTTFQYLKYHLIEKTTPAFFETVKQLQSLPEPIFTYEPVYALYAKKKLTYYYFTADMRYFRVEGKNLSGSEYLSILNKSNTVLLQHSWASFIPSSSIDYINSQFKLRYSDPENQIFVRDNL